MKFSEHFDSSEFSCRCGCGACAVDAALVQALETLRAKLGHAIRVTSGVRCATHNARIGGSPSSQHLYGRAADIAVHFVPGEELYRMAATIPAFHGFGVAGSWLHVDVRPGPVARWRYDNSGRVIAWPPGEQHG